MSEVEANKSVEAIVHEKVQDYMPQILQSLEPVLARAIDLVLEKRIGKVLDAQDLAASDVLVEPRLLEHNLVVFTRHPLNVESCHKAFVRRYLEPQSIGPDMPTPEPLRRFEVTVFTESVEDITHTKFFIMHDEFQTEMERQAQFLPMDECGLFYVTFLDIRKKEDVAIA